MAHKMSAQEVYANDLSNQFIGAMRQAIQQGVADNPGREAETKQQLFLAWMSAGFALAVNAAANFDHNRSPEAMLACMNEVGDLISRHYRSIPIPNHVTISGTANN